MIIDHPARHIFPVSPAGVLGRIARTNRCRSRLWLGVELGIGLGCELAVELVGETVLNVSVASGLGLEAATAVALGLVFGLRRIS